MIDKTTSRVIMGLLGTACVLITAFAWYKTKYAAVPEAGMHHNIYDEDIPRSAPVPVDYRMVLLTPQELAKAPLADVFTSPLGDENGAFTYVAQGVGDMNAARKGRHAGQDLNGIGGENTDEGLPVRAAGRGLLIYAGEPSPRLGQCCRAAAPLAGRAFCAESVCPFENRQRYSAGDSGGTRRANRLSRNCARQLFGAFAF